MKQKKAERWLSRYLDNELSGPDLEELRHLLQDDERLRETEQDWEEIRSMLTSVEVPPIQTSEAAWADIRRELRTAGDSGAGAGAWPVFDSRLRWAAGMVVLTLVAGYLWFSAGWGSRTSQMAQGPAAPESAPLEMMGGAVEVEWVESEVPGSTPMVFQDEESGLTFIWIVEATDQETGSS